MVIVKPPIYIYVTEPNCGYCENIGIVVTLKLSVYITELPVYITEPNKLLVYVNVAKKMEQINANFSNITKNLPIILTRIYFHCNIFHQFLKPTIFFSNPSSRPNPFYLCGTCLYN